MILYLREIVPLNRREYCSSLGVDSGPPRQHEGGGHSCDAPLVPASGV